MLLMAMGSDSNDDPGVEIDMEISDDNETEGNVAQTPVSNNTLQFAPAVLSASPPDSILLLFTRLD